MKFAAFLGTVLVASSTAQAVGWRERVVLGEAAVAQLRSREAEALCDSALSQARREPPDSLTARAAECLGDARSHLSAHAAASDAFREAVRIRESLGQKGQVFHSLALARVGSQETKLGNRGTARPLLEEAVRLLSSRAAEDADNTDTQLAFAYALAALARLEREGDHLDAAFDLQKRALEVRQAVSRYPATDAAVADSLNSLSLISQQRGDLKSAIAFARDGLAISEKISPKSAISKRINLAAALQLAGEHAEAQALYEIAIALPQKGEEDILWTVAAINLAILLVDTSNDFAGLATAEELLRRAIEVRRSLLGTQHADFIRTELTLGWIEGLRHRPAAAEAHTRNAAEELERLLGPVHRDVGIALSSHAQHLDELHQYSQSKSSHDRALAILGRGGSNIDLARALHMRALWDLGQGDCVGAESWLRKALTAHEQAVGTSHRERIAIEIDLADSLACQGREKDALQLLTATLATARSRRSRRSEALVLSSQARLLLDLGSVSEAHNLAAEAERLGNGTRAGSTTSSQFAAVLLAEGSFAEAERRFADVLRSFGVDPEFDATLLAAATNNLGVAEHASGKTVEAENHVRSALKHARLVPGSVDEAFIAANLGVLLLDRGALGEAETELQAARGSLISAFPEQDKNRIAISIAFGVLRLRQGRFDDSERELLQALQVSQTTRPEGLQTANALEAASELNLRRGVGDVRGPATQALLLRLNALGPTDPKLGEAIRLLAASFAREGQLARAETLLTLGSVQSAGALGPSHPATLALLKDRDTIARLRRGFWSTRRIRASAVATGILATLAAAVLFLRRRASRLAAA